MPISSCSTPIRWSRSATPAASTRSICAVRKCRAPPWRRSGARSSALPQRGRLEAGINVPESIAAHNGAPPALSRPLTAPLPNTLRMTDMTWVEVRSAIAQGYTRVIVPSGGIEQNGPHMILGKHDHIVGFAAERIAAELGRTLVAPVVSYVPQGSYALPEGNLRFPGTIGLPDDVYAGVLEGIAKSLKLAGFKTICLIADHGGSARPQAELAQRLSREWAADGVRVISVDDYYGAAGEEQSKLLIGQGETPKTIGQHA